MMQKALTVVAWVFDETTRVCFGSYPVYFKPFHEYNGKRGAGSAASITPSHSADWFELVVAQAPDDAGQLQALGPGHHRRRPL
jgi:hypothetical protein